MKNRYFSFIVLVCSLLAMSCGSGTPAVSSNETAAKPDRQEIVLTPAQQSTGMIQTQAAVLSDAPEILRASGRIVLADDRMWHVGVRSEGLVMMVYVGLGDHVKKGQILARYHADEVREARAQYRKSAAELNRLKAAEALAQRNFDRAQTLLSLKAASIQQVEQAKQELLGAQSATKSEEIEVDRGRDQLEDDLRVPADPPPGQQDETADWVPIIAPESGFVIEKNVTPGKTIQTTSDTFVIGDLSQVWMLASVRQEKLGLLRSGETATVTLPGDNVERFSGKLTNLGQQFDETTRAMQVRIVLNNPGNRLKPETLANAEIPIGKGKPALLVPSDSIQQINDQDVVFVKTAADRFVIRPVRTGETVGGKTPVFDGLKPGEQVVVQGSFVLKSQLLKSTMESE